MKHKLPHPIKGFTLIELLVVMSVIAIGSTAVYKLQNDQMDKRIAQKTVEGFALLDEGLYAYEVNNGSLPSTVAALAPFVPNLQNVDSSTGEGGRNGLGGRYRLVPFPNGIGIQTTLETTEQLRKVQAEFPNTSSIDTTAMTVTVGVPVAGLISALDAYLPKDGSEPLEGHLNAGGNDISDISQLKASVFIDRDNSSYSVNPNGRSELNTLDFRSARDQDNLAFGLNPSSTSRMNVVDANRVRAQSSFGVGSSCSPLGVGTYARSGSSPIFCNGSTWQRIGGSTVSVTYDRPVVHYESTTLILFILLPFLTLCH